MVSVPLAVVVTILFTSAALFSIARLTRSRSPITRANYGFHLLMGLAMIAMAWPATANLLAPVQVLVFAAATLWYGARFLTRRVRRPALDAYHAAMMASMTLMVLSMNDDGPSMSHGGTLGPALAASGGFFAVAVVKWALVLVQRIRGTWPSGLRNRLAGEAVYELVMAAGMAIMAFS